MVSRWRTLAAVAAGVVVAAACGGGSAGQSAGSGPIRIGAVASLSGPVTFADSPDAARAVFEQVNAQGGIHGRKIEYDVEDDKGDPQAATQAARDLVQNKQVVALAGSASLIDCEVNGAFYAREDVRSIQGLGVDPVCWHSPNISPVNVGPFTLTTAVLLYASNVLHDTRICTFFIIIGGPARRTSRRSSAGAS
jgi:branched-chain amino acid transport system substrate-binding protein